MIAAQSTHEIDAALTIGLLCDGKAIAKNDRALARFVRREDEAGRDPRLLLRSLNGGRLPVGAEAKITAQLSLRLRRAEQRAGTPPSLDARLIKYKRKCLAEIGSIIFQAMKSCSYRMASGKWVGGENTWSVRYADRADIERTTEKVWSANKKWSGLNAHATICMRKSWRQDVGQARLIAKVKGKRRVVLDVCGDVVTYIREGRGLALYVAVIDKRRVKWGGQ